MHYFFFLLDFILFPIYSPPLSHNPILSYPILFYCMLFYSILFSPILFYSILFYSTLFYSILFYFILLCSILFYSAILPDPIIITHALPLLTFSFLLYSEIIMLCDRGSVKSFINLPQKFLLLYIRSSIF